MVIITQNVFLLVHQTMLNVLSLILVLENLVTVNMPLAIVLLAEPDIPIPLFRKDICKMAKGVWIVTVSRNTKLKSILVTDF